MNEGTGHCPLNRKETRSNHLLQAHRTPRRTDPYLCGVVTQAQFR